MFDYDKWQEIFNTIRKNKLRTFLTALGVFWGIFMLILLMGAGTGLQNGVFSLFGKLARNAIFVGPTATTMPYMGLPVGRVPRLSTKDMEALQTHFSAEIEHLSPMLWVPSGEITRRGHSGAFDVEGSTPEAIFVEGKEMVNGRFINYPDLKEKRKVAVIGQKVRTQLFDEDENPVGQRLKVQGAEFLVVGVYKATTSDEEAADREEKTIILPLTTAQQITNRPDRISRFMCTIRPPHTATGMENRILGLLKERHKIHPDDPRGFWSDNIEEEVKNIMGLFIGIKLLVWFVGVGSLLFGIIGVGNIMLIVVKDRTKEIGIRKALGATPRSIISMILLESAFITTVAGHLGLVTSIGMVWAMKAAVGEGVSMFKNPEIDLSVGIGATLVLVIAGTLTGLVPALQAASVNPVEALKDE
ncbi:MAG: ABC transporter permease [Bacteroidetes bacterium]|nr:MAG: ABC transporter permease [Bacteroidota bacterium]